MHTCFIWATQYVTRCHALKVGDFKNLICQWVHEWQQFPELVMQPMVGSQRPGGLQSPHFVRWQPLETFVVASLAVIN